MSVIRTTASCVAMLAAATTVASAQSREQVQIAGSSTVLPYASIVAELFADNTEFEAPVVQSGGSSAGLRQFCEGVGENTIDIANASRAISDSEIETCRSNGVNEIIEVRIGYDGIVFASKTDGPDFTAFEQAQWYQALAKELPQDGGMVSNPNTNWSDVDSSLPDVEILTFIPGTNHGTREVFEEKVILAGCETTGARAQILEINGGDEDAADATCMELRSDGAAVEIQGDYTETLNRLNTNSNGVGVFGLSFYENNTDTLKVATMGGVEPTTDTIAAGEYPVSRPLYFYIKKAHIGVVPGVKEYATFFVADEVAGPGGPLANYGLVPDPELSDTQQKVENETTMDQQS